MATFGYYFIYDRESSGRIGHNKKLGSEGCWYFLDDLPDHKRGKICCQCNLIWNCPFCFSMHLKTFTSAEQA